MSLSLLLEVKFLMTLIRWQMVSLKTVRTLIERVLLRMTTQMKMRRIKDITLILKAPQMNMDLEVDQREESVNSTLAVI